MRFFFTDASSPCLYLNVFIKFLNLSASPFFPFSLPLPPYLYHSALLRSNSLPLSPCLYLPTSTSQPLAASLYLPTPSSLPVPPCLKLSALLPSIFLPLPSCLYLPTSTPPPFFQASPFVYLPTSTSQPLPLRFSSKYLLPLSPSLYLPTSTSLSLPLLPTPLSSKYLPTCFVSKFVKIILQGLSFQLHAAPNFNKKKKGELR